MDKINQVLLENNDRLMAQVEAQAKQIKLLNEQPAYLTFGTSSEKTPNDSQLSLFEDQEVFNKRSQPK